MAATQTVNVTEIKIENFLFPPSVKTPASSHSFFLAGAGVRGMELGGNFVKFTAIGVYMEDSAIDELSCKWKGKTAKDLAASDDFFRHIVTGQFEKFTEVTMILPLTGQQYSEKVAENCVKIWKSIGIYTDDEAKAIEKFLEVFKDEKFAPGQSIMFTQSPDGSLTITFSKHGSIPHEGKAVIKNKHLSEAVLQSIIGKDGVSPAAKLSIADRVSTLLNEKKTETNANGTNEKEAVNASETVEA